MHILLLLEEMGEAEPMAPESLKLLPEQAAPAGEEADSADFESILEGEG